MGAHVGKYVEVAIAQGVVKQHAIALRNCRRATDDVNDGNVFRESTGDAIDGRELAYSKGGDEGSDLGDAGVTVGSIGFERVSAAKRASACRYASKDVAVQGGVEEVPSPICKMRSHDMMGGEG